MYVEIKNVNSIICKATYAGVPQKFIFGPQLFVIHLNGVSGTKHTNIVNIALFSDDKIIRSC